jgi:SWI/SNF-related matrix-associated actin-dependent regulator 1 of chromatin subfamily A
MNKQLQELTELLSDLARVAPAIVPDASLHALSSANDGEVSLDLAQPLFPFQRAGVAYALKQKRVIIGDEMGLGKTPQGIAVAVQAHAEGHKVLVVVPPSLRVNWLRSFAMFAPWLTVEVVKGNKVTAFPKSNVVIIGDSNVDAWSIRFAGKFGALVVDEAHRAKSVTAGRTKGIRHIAKSIPDNGYIVLLSGTIVVNRPNELVSPLSIIDRLDRVFGGKSAFLFRYCEPTHNGWGWLYNGASNTAELNDKLRGTCYVRRRKADVLSELPAKRRAQIATEISDKDLATYRHAEDDFRDFVITNGGAEAWDRASRAEVITRLNALRKLLGLAKVNYVVEHVEELVAEGEKVIVFAHHTDVINQIAEALNEHGVVKVVGGMTDEGKQNAVDSFQTGDAKVFVGQFTAAGVGLTLTASSHVVFAELPWTPAEAVQAEDRAHRIGQTNAVVAWWMTAVDSDPSKLTVDDRMWALLNHKHEIVSAVLDGYGEDMGAEGNLAQALIEGIVGNG